MKLKLTLVSSVLTVLLWVGCSNRHTEVEETLRKQIDSASKHLLYLDNFRKIDGVEVQKETLRYELTFKCFIGANKSVIWKPIIYHNYDDHSKIRLELPVESNDNNDTYFMDKDYGHEIDGRAVFEKRDSGWKLIAIYL